MPDITIEDRRYSSRQRRIGIKEICRIAKQKDYNLGRLLVVMEKLTLNQLKSVVKIIKDEKNLFRSLVLLKIGEIEEGRTLKKFLELPKEDQEALKGTYRGDGFSIKLLPTTKPLC